MLLAPERISQVVAYILEHFDQKTRRSQGYNLGEKRVAGFNSMFATASIAARQGATTWSSRSSRPTLAAIRRTSR